MSGAEGSRGRASWGLFLVRVTVGLLLVTEGWTAVQEGLPTANELARSVELRGAEHGGPLAWWAEEVLGFAPAATAAVWRWGLFLVGVFLVLGAFTRPVGLLAALFMTHAWAFGPEALSESFLLAIACCLSASIAGSGRHFGLDSIFDQHFPSWLTWVRAARSPFG